MFEHCYNKHYLLVNWAAIVPLRLSKDELNIGDEAVHGEKAFALVDDRERFEVSPKHNSVYDIEEFSYVGSRSVGEVQMVWLALRCENLE